MPWAIFASADWQVNPCCTGVSAYRYKLSARAQRATA